MRPTSQQLIRDAIRDHEKLLRSLSISDLAEEDDVVLRLVGYRLVQSGDRHAFVSGRRLLDRAARGRLFPPPHQRWWMGPGKRTADLEAILNPYSVELVWRDGKARWEIGGRLWLHGSDRDWRWYPLLHVDGAAEWARTNLCWMRLGKRMQRAV